ncbi:hypothetical protein Curi_c07890 [Gottschalkia acidurici 9a]|uniref:Cyclic lactone autoinducer peptide n=1 Tax=Gottschalkia acidurici (strain ATCC 7906 / DSM 604 / BCRC 14475 / CIP 104303 / KCTC 5404 / NCIMB 10678 / 9a) TaxID=1128398 RepID=K0AYL5_GOTA9|nr:cyclic lactone autoinducer peptide [Gottschalkia acidurici]AFS77862.1 hypothetical protein Curi_c07890 [Gottschalkia acidurici 9a]
MSNINKNSISKFEEKFFDVLASISEKIADRSMGACIAYFAYEPKLPEELIQNMKEED